jgi:hypothetical protein
MAASAAIQIAKILVKAARSGGVRKAAAGAAKKTKSISAKQAERIAKGLLDDVAKKGAKAKIPITKFPPKKQFAQQADDIPVRSAMENRKISKFPPKKEGTVQGRTIRDPKEQAARDAKAKNLRGIRAEANRQKDVRETKSIQEEARFRKQEEAKASRSKEYQKESDKYQKSRETNPQGPPAPKSVRMKVALRQSGGRALEKGKKLGKKGMAFAKEHPVAAGLGVLGGGSTLYGSGVLAEKVGTDMGLDPFDYQGKLRDQGRVRSAAALMDEGNLLGELAGEEMIARELRRGGVGPEVPDVMEDLLRDQDLAAVLEGRMDELRSIAVQAQPQQQRSSVMELAARFGLI